MAYNANNSGQNKHDMNTNLRIINAVIDLKHFARCLMAESHRHRSRPISADHRQIRMTQVNCMNFYQHLTLTGRV